MVKAIQDVYNKYEHLNKLLSTCGDEEFTLVMLREFWLAIKAEVHPRPIED